MHIPPIENQIVSHVTEYLDHVNALYNLPNSAKQLKQEKT